MHASACPRSLLIAYLSVNKSHRKERESTLAGSKTVGSNFLTFKLPLSERFIFCVDSGGGYKENLGEGDRGILSI